jgi:hypothetical protein
MPRKKREVKPSPRVSCAFYFRDDLCACLTEMVCAQAGNCRFYKRKDKFDFGKVEDEIAQYGYDGHHRRRLRNE